MDKKTTAPATKKNLKLGKSTIKILRGGVKTGIRAGWCHLKSGVYTSN